MTEIDDGLTESVKSRARTVSPTVAVRVIAPLAPVTVGLTVRARDFTLSVSPSSISVIRGQTASYSVAVGLLGGFAGNVTLSVSGVPSGSIVSWSANPVAAPGSSTLRVGTTKSSLRGTFTVRVTGTSGTLVHQVSVTLIVR